MALSYSLFNGDGSTKDFVIGFSYIETAHVKVTVDKQAVGYTVDGVNKVVRLDTAPANGSVVRLYRETPLFKTYSDFKRGNAFGQSNVNNSFLWQLMLSQELSEGRKAADNVADQDLNMGGFKVINMEDGVDESDAVTVKQLETRIQEIDYQAVVPISQPRQVIVSGQLEYDAPHIKASLPLSFFVQLDGITQRPVTDYTTDTIGKLTFTSQPPVGANLDIRYFEPNVMDDVLTVNSLQKHTTLSFFSYGSLSAVESMLSAFNQNPFMFQVGSYMCTGGTTWEYIDSTGPITIENFRAFDVVNVWDFGAKPDPDYNSGPAIQAAIDTRRNVFIPSGEYGSHQTLHPYKQQEIAGEGGTQRSAKQDTACTSIIFESGLHGFDTSVNIALGCKFKRIMARARDQVTGNGATGFKLGIKGTAGGSSQSLKIEMEDLYASGFDICYGIYGWAWEVTGRRCFADKPRLVGFDFDDAPTVTSFYDCSVLQAGAAFASSPANLSAKSFVFNGDSQVYLSSPRAENTQGTAYDLNGSAKVTIDSIYCEGNRLNDINLANDYEGSLIINGGRFEHDNSGVNTFSCIRNTSTKKCYVEVNGVKYKIGVNTDNTTTSGFYYSESKVPQVFINGLVVVGNVSRLTGSNREVVYLSQSGRYAPTEFSVTDLPNVRFYQNGNSHIAKIQNELPTSLLISDGTSSHDMLKDDSIGEVKSRLYRWVSAKNAWALVTQRSYAKVDLVNSSEAPFKWWGDNKGIEVVRYNNGPATTTVKVDTTGAEEGADFFVTSYSTQTTPADVTIIDQNNQTLGTINHVASSGAGSITAHFAYFNRLGISTSFQLVNKVRGVI